MTYKMVCIDLDGTLLNSNKKISNYTLNILREVHEKGLHIIITTGRTYSSARIYYELLGINCPIICSSGATILSPYLNNTLYNSSFNYNELLNLLDIFNKNRLNFNFYSNNDIYSNNIITFLLTKLIYLKQGYSNDFNIRHKIVRRDEWEKLFKSNELIIKGICYSLRQKKINTLYSLLSKECTFSSYLNNKNTLEINSLNINKGNAVKVLSTLLNIDKKDIICFGDSENDISMIKYAGLGICMANGLDSLKEVSNMVTSESNDNDGVAKTLENIILS